MKKVVKKNATSRLCLYWRNKAMPLATKPIDYH